MRATSMTGRRPDVTSRGSHAHPSRADTSSMKYREYKVPAATMFSSIESADRFPHVPSGRRARIDTRPWSWSRGCPARDS